MFIRLGRAYSLGRDFEVIISGGGSEDKPKRDEVIFMEEVDPLKLTPYKDFNLAIVGELGWMKWLKMGQGKVYISCNYSYTMSFLVKILLVKLN